MEKGIMKYQEYKQKVFPELKSQIDAKQDRLVVIGEGTPHEKIAVESVNFNSCSRSLSLWDLYYEQNRYELTDQVKLICDFFTKRESISTIEKLEHITLWPANLKNAGPKLDEKEIPYAVVGDMAVYFKFYYQVYGEEEHSWPCDYERLVLNGHLKEWGLTPSELMDAANQFDIAERLQTVLDWSDGVLNRVIGDISDIIPHSSDPKKKVYLVSGENGAGMMFYRDGMQTVTERVGNDIYILPIPHTGLLVCSSAAYGIKELQCIMQRQADYERKWGTDVLMASQSVYRFKAEDRSLHLAASKEGRAKRR
ncbi:DUF5688 family protein [[Clostridium] symbiosum]|uniref:DUF5688 family protein n=1 Tax=Clostridium symbiosum TaxID=1512 RepID=UPI001AA171C4|nr:DUF5688 family protein [[Clostridium] symbiosum]MBO1695222.1 hypothetical protein [[Clostridium] symbiosum]